MYKPGLVNILFFFLVFLFISCNKEPDKIGLKIRPDDDQVNIQYTDTTKVLAYSVLEDSVRTDETQYSLLGSYLDPVFGKTTACIFTQVRLSENGYEFGSNPVLDSLVFTLDYSGYYGDTNTLQVFRIFELSEELYKDSIYYSNDYIPNQGIELANISFYPRPNKKITIGEEEMAPHLRIKLYDEFGDKILTAPESTFVDNDSFLEFLKGFYIMAEPVTTEGAILYFDLMSELSQMVIYYSNDEQDSLSFEFIINEKCARFINYNHYDYENADPEFKAQVLNDDTTLGENRLYLQAMGGVKTKIFFPDIKELNANGRVAVNEAKLVINGYEEITDYKAPDRLVLIQITEDGSTKIIIDQYENYFGGSYDSTANQYIFRITRYIQSLLQEGNEDYGIYLMIIRASLVANRFVFNGTLPDPQTPFSKRFKLNVTYTHVE
jgi:hypothetical protein